MFLFFVFLLILLFSELDSFIYQGEEKEDAVYETLTTALAKRLKKINNSMTLLEKKKFSQVANPAVYSSRGNRKKKKDKKEKPYCTWLMQG